MTSRRTTDGLHEFVDTDTLEHLDAQLGRHAPPMGTKKTYHPEPTQSYTQTQTQVKKNWFTRLLEKITRLARGKQLSKVKE